MYKEYADFALKFLKKNEVEYGEVRLEEHEGSGVVLKNSTPELSGFETAFGMGIRFLIKGGMGFVSVNNFKKDKIQKNIEEALRLVKKGIKFSDKIGLSREKVHKKDYKVTQKIKLKDVEPGDELNLLKETDKEINKALGRYLSLHSNVTKKYFINTEGSRISSEIPRVNLFYMMTVKEGNKSTQKYWQYGNTGGFEFVNKWNLPILLRKEFDLLMKNLREAKKPPKGKIDLVLGPEVTGIMVHESCGHPLEADRILGREAAQAGESFVNKDMKGNKIGNEIVTIVDDPTLENSAGYYLYDDEGVKARRRYLYKKGKINEFLHNRETAFDMGLKSNGAARAEDFDKETIVRMANTFLLPGEHKEEELIKDVKLGVYMRDFTEWNIDDKRYQQKYVGNDAWLIENGELKHPVFRPIIEITTPKLWSSVDAIGKKMEYHAGTCGKGEPMQGVPVWFGGPGFRLKGIRLG